MINLELFQIVIQFILTQRDKMYGDLIGKKKLEPYFCKTEFIRIHKTYQQQLFEIVFNLGHCIMTNIHCFPQIYWLVHMVIFFIIPILIIGFFYIMIARILVRSSSMVPTESRKGDASRQRQSAARRKVGNYKLQTTCFDYC